MEANTNKKDILAVEALKERPATAIAAKHTHGMTVFMPPFYQTSPPPKLPSRVL